MTRKLLSGGVLLAILAVVPACKEDALVTETMTEVDALAEDIVSTVEKASDKKQGVADAQKRLDEAKAALGAKVEEVNGLRRFQVSEEVTADFARSIAESTIEVETLKLSLMSQTMNDPELDAAVDALTADFAQTLKR